MSKTIPKNQVKSVTNMLQAEHCDDADAKRVKVVDENGDVINDTNPFCVKIASIAPIINANLHVQLTHEDDDPIAGAIHDSVRIGDGTNLAKVNADGSFFEPDIEPEQFEAAIITAGTPDSLVITGRDIQLAFVFNPNKGPNKNDKNDVLFITIDGSAKKTTVPRGDSRYFPGVFSTFKVDTNANGTNYEVILWANQ